MIGHDAVMVARINNEFSPGVPPFLAQQNSMTRAFPMPALPKPQESCMGQFSQTLEAFNMSNLIKATKLHTKGPWHYEYLPYYPMGVSTKNEEIPCFRIYPCEKSANPADWIAETNADLPIEVQEANAILICAATEMLKALHDIKKITINYKHLPTEPVIRLKRIIERVTSILNTTC